MSAAPLPSSRPTLSLCMIVKNEEGNLETCLKHARPHVDEIVIVDTGSTDGTLEIARRYADVIDEIEWPGSFSIARNHSLSLATSDYILILDGDEYIEGEDAWARLLENLSLLDVAAILLPIRNLLGEGSVVEADLFWQERILRNTPEIRYHGSVHNQISESVIAHAKKHGRHIIRVQVEVVHTGYSLSEEDMIRKYETRVALLKHEYENAKDKIYQAYYAYQLGLIYYIMKKNEAAAELFDNIDYAFLSPENGFYTRLLGAQTALRLEDFGSALVHCNEMLSINPKEPVAFYLAGVSLLRSQRVSDGMLMLLQAYNVSNEADCDIRFEINPPILVEHLKLAFRGIGLPDHAEYFDVLLESESLDEGRLGEYIAYLQAGFARSDQAEQAEKAQEPASSAVTA